MNEQPSLVEASRPSGQVVDETGDLAEHHDHGAVYSDGEYDLDGTIEVLEDRFAEIRDDLPDEVGVWKRDGFRYREVVSVTWSVERQNGDREFLSLFPRGPYLHEWSLNLNRYGADRDVSGTANSSRPVMEGSGYHTPAAALEDAITFMEADR